MTLKEGWFEESVASGISWGILIGIALIAVSFFMLSSVSKQCDDRGIVTDYLLLTESGKCTVALSDGSQFVVNAGCDTIELGKEVKWCKEYNRLGDVFKSEVEQK